MQDFRDTSASSQGSATTSSTSQRSHHNNKNVKSKLSFRKLRRRESSQTNRRVDDTVYNSFTRAISSNSTITSSSTCSKQNSSDCSKRQSFPSSAVPNNDDESQLLNGGDQKKKKESDDNFPVAPSLNSAASVKEAIRSKYFDCVSNRSKNDNDGPSAGNSKVKQGICIDGAVDPREIASNDIEARRNSLFIDINLESDDHENVGLELGQEIGDGSKTKLETKSMIEIEAKEMSTLKHDQRYSDTEEDINERIPSPAFSRKSDKLIMEIAKEVDGDKSQNLDQNNSSDGCPQKKECEARKIAGATKNKLAKPTKEMKCDILKVQMRNDSTAIAHEANPPYSTPPKPLGERKKMMSNKSPGLDDHNVPGAKRLADEKNELDTTHADPPVKSDINQNPTRNTKQQKRPRKRHKQPKRDSKRRCTLCTSCSCSSGSALKEIENDERNTLSSLARSDAEVERALLRRLAKFEKSVTWFDHLAFKVNRDLKKHRNKIMKKREENNAGAGTDAGSVFLEDVEEGDNNFDMYGTLPLNRPTVEKAKNRMFAFRKKRQPTLTQMFDNHGEGNNEGETCIANGDTERKVGKGTKMEQPEKCKEQNFCSADENDLVILEVDSVQDNNSDREVNEGRLESDGGDLLQNDSNLNDLEKAKICKNSFMWEASRLETKAFTRVNLNFENQIDLEDRWDTNTFNLGARIDVTEKNVNNVTEENLSSPKSCSNAEGRVEESALSDILSFNNDSGIDDLLLLFQDDVNNENKFGEEDDKLKDNSYSSETSIMEDETQITFSQLTQSKQSISNLIEESILSNPQKFEAISAECPNWKENVMYALLKTDHDDVSNALFNVRNQRGQIKKAKEKIFDLIEKQDSVLELYETALVESLKLLEGNSPSSVVQ